MQKLRKTLSALLCIALVLGIAPAILSGEPASAAKKKTTYVYTFSQLVTGDNWAGSDASPANAKWQFAGNSDLLAKTVSIGSNGGLYFTSGDGRFWQDQPAGEWMKVKISVPKAGTYKVKTTTCDDRYYSGHYVYITPGDVNLTVMKGETDYRIGELLSAAYLGGMRTNEFGEWTCTTPGTYNVYFLTQRHGGFYFEIKSLELEGTTEEEAPVSEQPTLTYKLNSLPTGDNWAGSDTTPANAKWQFVGNSDLLAKTVSIGTKGGLYFTSGTSLRFWQDQTAGEWMKIKISVPAAGTYKVSTTTCDDRYYSGHYVYITPGDVNLTVMKGEATYCIGALFAAAYEGGMRTHEFGEWTCEVPGTYNVYFLTQRHGGNYFEITDLTLKGPGTQISTDGGTTWTNCETLADAITAIGSSGGTVKLMDSATATDLENMESNCKIDLNGQKLTVDSIFSLGNVVDSKEGVGKLVIKDDILNSMLDSTNTALPIFDENGYRLMSFAGDIYKGGIFSMAADKNSAKVWFTWTFTNEDAWDLIPEDNEGVKLALNASLSGGDNASFFFGDELLNSLCEQIKAGNQSGGFWVRLNGLQDYAGQTITLKPTLSSDLFTAQLGSCSFTIPAA